jgi:AcrR family transcriptional regulator
MDFSERIIPTPQERRERNREEMASAILEAARAIMREEGAGALNLSEIARRVNLTTPALYSYFENKFAIYDALYLQGLHIMRDYDLEVWRAHEPGWERIRAWLEARLRFAMEYPELYHLMFSAPVPGYLPSEGNVAETQKQLANARRGLTEVINAGFLAPNVPTDRAVDLLLAIRHGILAERIGKANVVPADSGRFEHLVDDAISMLQLAWAPGSVDSDGKGGADRER